MSAPVEYDIGVGLSGCGEADRLPFIKLTCFWICLSVGFHLETKQ